MELKGNVIAAVTTAVQLYMQTIQAEQQASMAIEPQAEAPAVPRPAYSAWAISGRQSSMEMRRFWQMRLVR